MKKNYKSLAQMLKCISEESPNIKAQIFKDENKEFQSISYKELYNTVLDFSTGLLSIGATPKSHIALIADNRKEWLHASFGIMSIGAADVPRGCDATEQDLIHILSFSECEIAILENESQIKKVLTNAENFPLLKNIISIENIGENRFRELEEECLPSDSGVVSKFSFYTYNSIIEVGKKERADGNNKADELVDSVEPDQLASIIYTSGTTGTPKGVTMTHRNFMAQLPELRKLVLIEKADTAISVLPVWHAFERACEYVTLSATATIAYSKPIGSVLLSDMKNLNPTLFPSVPRIWESVYDGIFKAMRKEKKQVYFLFRFFVSVGKITTRFQRNITGQRPHFRKLTKFIYPVLNLIPFMLMYPFYCIGRVLIFRKIQKKLGNKFKIGVSGGGALPPHIDEFFWAVGINIVEGYGITETAPVVCVRSGDKPVFGTLGTPLKCFESKIVDKNGKIVPCGKKGSLLLRGDAVTKGYYNQLEKTAEAISADGWFDTGDLAVKTIDGELILKGRKKNTIVLRGGENIEPTPIEMKLQESPLISTAVVFGQDQRALGALIVVSQEDLAYWAKDNKLSSVSIKDLVQDANVQKLYEEEVAGLINHRSGFKLFEKINKIVLLSEAFEQGKELSAKGELKRHRIESIYKKQIKELFV